MKSARCDNATARRTLRRSASAASAVFLVAMRAWAAGHQRGQADEARLVESRFARASTIQQPEQLPRRLRTPVR